MSAIFEIENLRVAYNGDAVLHGVAVSLERGSIVGIVGESGCGKTTLLRAALGMLGQAGEVCGGSIRFAGKDVSGMTQTEHLSYVSTVASLVSQNPQRAFSPVRTLGSQFEETALLRGELSRGEARARAVSLLGRLGLSDPERVLDSYVFELSGGMAQRAAIGLALMNSPKVVFADEPTSALDVAVQAQVVEELISANHEFGVSLLVVSHNIAVMAHMAQYLYVMKDGEVVEQAYFDGTRVLIDGGKTFRDFIRVNKDSQRLIKKLIAQVSGVAVPIGPYEPRTAAKHTSNAEHSLHALEKLGLEVSIEDSTKKKR